MGNQVRAMKWLIVLAAFLTLESFSQASGKKNDALASQEKNNKMGAWRNFLPPGFATSTHTHETIVVDEQKCGCKNEIHELEKQIIKDQERIKQLKTVVTKISQDFDKRLDKIHTCASRLIMYRHC